ncbi:MAG: DUF4325 domain-containing protein [Desulfurellaceae bacterium]|nr:DUF4325 domain-containing protein [Desulfurellaceae bacterium]
MAGIRERGRLIRDYILKHVDSNSQNIAQETASHFGISRQAVNTHISRLVREGLLTARGATRNRRYSLAILREELFEVPLTDETAEHIVWQKEVEPLLSDIPKTARDIWHYGFTEMLNNAIDHSSGTRVMIEMKRTVRAVNVMLSDDGEGIFRKIQKALALEDERHAVLELAKGKFTTDPDHHTGEGIFFTSRMFDKFTLLAGNVYFSHKSPGNEDWILENRDQRSGTAAFLELYNDTERTTRDIFDQFTVDSDYGFSKTIVPVDLVQYGDASLISRSQAKRLLTRFDRFRTVILDFKGVEQVGQGFADEVFRVFTRANPTVHLVPINENIQVHTMIRRAMSTT